MHGFDADWADAALAFGGVARLDGGAGRVGIQILKTIGDLFGAI